MSDTPKQCKRMEIGPLSMFTLPLCEQPCLALEKTPTTILYWQSFWKKNGPETNRMLGIDCVGDPFTIHEDSPVVPYPYDHDVYLKLTAIYNQRIKALDVCRKDIKSGQFFTDAGDHRNPKDIYLAVERNADTEFYFRSSHNCPCSFDSVRQTSQVRSILREDEMLCISSDGRMLTTHAESRVSLAEDNPALPVLRDQLASIYCDSLKEYAKDAHVEPAGLPLLFTEPQFYSPLNVPQAQAIPQALVPKSAKLKDGWKISVKPDRVDVIVKPDIVNVDRFEFAQVKEIDAVDRLYQDQLDYQKREDKKAHDETIARCQKYLSEYIPDKNTQNDHRVASERGRTATTASEGIRGVAIYSERIAVKIASLNKHGWGATSKQEEKELREANAELQALVKAWGKRFPTLRTKQALNSLKHSETHNLNKKLKLENTEL